MAPGEHLGNGRQYQFSSTIQMGGGSFAKMVTKGIHRIKKIEPGFNQQTPLKISSLVS